jgi:2-methylcitrate dehydratase PrpD
VRLEGGFEMTAGRLRIVQQGLSIKKYPVCYSTHRVVDAAAQLARTPGFDPARVRRTVVHIGDTQAWMARHHLVRTPFEAKYSVEFAAASGLVARDAGFAQLVPEFIGSETVQKLIGCTELVLRTDKSAEDPVFASADRVVLELEDGSTLDSGEVRFATGHALLPLGEEESRRKFVQCARSGGLGENANDLYGMLQNLAGLADVREIARVASSASSRA